MFKSLNDEETTHTHINQNIFTGKKATNYTIAICISQKTVLALGRKGKLQPTAHIQLQLEESERSNHDTNAKER